MAAIKIGSLILYCILAYVAITAPLTLGANIGLGVLVFLALAHLVECFLYRALIRRAPGSPTWHALNVFLFGVFHMVAMKDALRSRRLDTA